ncbi:MAG: TldD/PmbA family protein [Syntrophomonadaceae bacterium]
MEETLRKAGDIVLDRVNQQGLEGEVFLLHDRELNIEIRQGLVETLKQAEETGIGLRVFNAGRIGFAYSSDLSSPALQKLVDDAVSISAYTAADEYNILPQGKRVYPEVEVYDPELATASLEAKMESAREVERIARAYDPRIELVEKATYGDGEYSMLIMNNRGIYAFGQGNYCALSTVLVAREDDDRQNGYAFSSQRMYRTLDARLIGEEAALKALRSLKARTIPSAQMPCVMEPYVVVRFLGLIAASVQADAVQKGKSMLAGKVGQAVASPVVDLVDDGRLPGGMVSSPFDGEGVPTQRNVVVEKGVLQDFLYDTYTGLKAKRQSSGNARRSSFRILPAVGISNFMLGPGEKSPAELREPISRGLYITEVMGMHTANPISGDFSVGAAGIMIEDGQLTHAVRGVTIAGNLLELLQDIDAVGNDLRFFGSLAAPSLRLTKLCIGGN